MLYIVCEFDNCMLINRKCTTHLDQTTVLLIIQVVPGTFFPILKRHWAKFAILTGRTLGSSFSFSPFLSLYTPRSLVTRRSLRSSLPLQSSVTFIAFSPIMAITSVTSVVAWCPWSTIPAGRTRTAITFVTSVVAWCSWSTIPAGRARTAITKRWTLLVSNRKISKFI